MNARIQPTNVHLFNPPATIADYLERLRNALAGADPALVQDALYDAEEYLRSELAENPGRSEAQVIAAVAGSYGAPDEVADIYRDTEVKVQTALRTPQAPRSRSLLARFFAVAADPRAYSALFYMLLSMVTGIFYFTWVTVGASLSAGLMVLIIGIPVLVLFLGSVRMLALVEGRLVEVMLGERMPRRPLYSDRGKPWLQRIGAMFTDPHTWGTLLYFLLMLPLGVIYFSVAITLLATTLAFMAAPIALLFGAAQHVMIGPVTLAEAPWMGVPMFAFGALMLFVTLHIARGVGRLHGQLAKHLLVRTSQYA